MDAMPSVSSDELKGTRTSINPLTTSICRAVDRKGLCFSLSCHPYRPRYVLSNTLLSLTLSPSSVFLSPFLYFLSFIREKDGLTFLEASSLAIMLRLSSLAMSTSTSAFQIGNSSIAHSFYQPRTIMRSTYRTRGSQLLMWRFLGSSIFRVNGLHVPTRHVVISSSRC